MLGEDLHDGRPTTSMKKGWLCRNSYDEIVHTWWWPKEIQIELWSRSNYDDSERSRSSDDPDPAVMIQILSREMIQIELWSRSCPERWSRSSDDPDLVQWCWSRSSDDLDPVMPFYDDPDREMIQIQMTWWWRWLEDEEDLMTEMTWRWKWSNDTEKKTSAENCVERIPS